MKRFTKYHKKMRLAYIATTFVVSALFICIFPWFRQAAMEERGYYTVVLNGEAVGVTYNVEDAEEAYLSARLLIENENDSFVYMEPEFEVYKEDKLFGTDTQKAVLIDNIYDVLTTSDIEVKKQGFVVDIDGFTVVLSSREEVVSLLEAAKGEYDEDDLFHIELEENSDGHFNSYTTQLIKADTHPKTSQKVMSTASSTTTATTNLVQESQGLAALEFDENVQIIESFVSTSDIMTLQDAIDAVTKDKEENKIYTIVAGDTLSEIAYRYNLSLDKLLAMNPSLTVNSVIQVGDDIVVTVPQPELSVVVVENKTYEENYYLPVVYVYNDSKYSTYSNVITNGVAGHRIVNADISYRNNEEIGRTIIDQKIVSEPVAEVIEVGTLTPPTYIMPINWYYYVSDYYGWRNETGSFHNGVDFAVSSGTTVRAACAGYVSQAGWNGSFGNCILITHSDGSQTRYAHLSSVEVYVGQYVQQNERIGLTGNTGFSTGPHLHFELWINGYSVNPFKYI